MYKSILISVVSLVLTACAVPKYNYTPQAIQISEPPLGSTNIAEVGDSLLRQGFYVEQDAIYLPVKADPSWAFTLTPGFYIKHGDDAEAEYFIPAGGDGSGSIQKAALADPWKSVMTLNKTQTLCIVTVFNARTCSENQNFEHTKRPMLSQNSFQQTLIYNGRIGQKINIGYRETSNSMARPAFNNNVEYDLSDSKIIGYKGASLEIMEATNQSITYRIIRNFNKAN
jgi:hypothetical protein